MHACKQTETSLVELQSGLHLLLQWPHTASIIQRSSRWQDNPVCDVIFWFPRFTQGVSATHQPTAREILFMPGRFAIYSVRKEFLGTGVYVSCGRALFNFYTGRPSTKDHSRRAGIASSNFFSVNSPRYSYQSFFS